MKKVLITGKNSYIGKSLINWLKKYPDKYYTEELDLHDISWKEKDFSDFDVVFHVAGIAHIKETSDNRDLYYKVNRDLAYETALKAKKAGVGQFIFLSSMSIYGIKTGGINENTLINPSSAYGKSKFEAEILINKLQVENDFTITILRPPMVYGKGCKGNYQKLANLALKTPIFPKINNKRSMIYIDNLTELVKILIDNDLGGTFHPQNQTFIDVSELVYFINLANHSSVYMTKVFNYFIKLLNIKIIKKVFGSLFYKKDISSLHLGYNIVNFKQSIIDTEKGNNE